MTYRELIEVLQELDEHDKDRTAIVVVEDLYETTEIYSEINSLRKNIAAEYNSLYLDATERGKVPFGESEH